MPRPNSHRGGHPSRLRGSFEQARSNTHLPQAKRLLNAPPMTTALYMCPTTCKCYQGGEARTCQGTGAH
jgi:hypothetical protein